jgi:xanthine/CO dehydrogenase XdhC/CoxF family maturation factor
MNAEQNSTKSDSTKHETTPAKGDLVRYGTGSTALMVLETRLDAKTDAADAWSGPQCTGGRVTVYTKDMKPASFKDRRTWVAHAQFRKQTIDEAMTQIGYVLGEEDPSSPAEPARGTHWDKGLTKGEEAIKHTIAPTDNKRLFVDTPEAKRQAAYSEVLESTIPMHYFTMGLFASAIGAVVGAIVAKLL